MRCKICGSKRSMKALLTGELLADYVCDRCRRKAYAQRNEEKERIRALAARVIVTSTNNIDGHIVRRYLGIESVECVIGTGMFAEITTEIRDFFGLRSTAFERKLQDAKAAAFDALKLLAAEKGANAIVGVDLDYTEFSGNRIGLIVNGTLVRVGPAQAVSID